MIGGTGSLFSENRGGENGNVRVRVTGGGGKHGEEAALRIATVGVMLAAVVSWGVVSGMYDLWLS